MAVTKTYLKKIRFIPEVPVSRLGLLEAFLWDRTVEGDEFWRREWGSSELSPEARSKWEKMREVAER